MDKKMFELDCEDGFLVRSEDMDEVIHSAQSHMKEKHHEDLKPDEVRSQVREVHVSM